MAITSKIKETLPRVKEALPRVKEALPKVKEAFPNLKEILPKTTERVSRHTAEFRNRRIWNKTEKNVRYFAEHPEAIDKRLDQLDREWDIERTLEANAASLAMLGVGLSIKDKRFLVLPGLVTGFLLQHAIQGWCPPVPLLRKLGVRTQTEIEAERRSLQALKDAFTDLEKRVATTPAKGTSTVGFKPAATTII